MITRSNDAQNNKQCTASQTYGTAYYSAVQYSVDKQRRKQTKVQQGWGVTWLEEAAESA